MSDNEIKNAPQVDAIYLMMSQLSWPAALPRCHACMAWKGATAATEATCEFSCIMGSNNLQIVFQFGRCRLLLTEEANRSHRIFCSDLFLLGPFFLLLFWVEVQDGRADEVSVASVRAHGEAGAEMLPEDVPMFLGNPRRSHSFLSE